MVPAPSDAARALVMPGGPPPPPTPGVVAAFESIFKAVRKFGPEVVTQHAFDAPAFELARGLPVLHTLHLPPLVDAVVAAARTVPSSRLATVSRSCDSAWRSAGVEVGQVLPNGVGDLPVGFAPTRTALIAGRISPEK